MRTDELMGRERELAAALDIVRNVYVRFGRFGFRNAWKVPGSQLRDERVMAKRQEIAFPPCDG